MGLATGFSIEGFFESNKILGSLMGKRVKYGFCVGEKEERESFAEQTGDLSKLIQDSTYGGN